MQNHARGSGRSAPYDNNRLETWFIGIETAGIDELYGCRSFKALANGQWEYLAIIYGRTQTSNRA